MSFVIFNLKIMKKYALKIASRFQNHGSQALKNTLHFIEFYTVITYYCKKISYFFKDGSNQLNVKILKNCIILLTLKVILSLARYMENNR